jgi:hypothetical protein
MNVIEENSAPVPVEECLRAMARELGYDDVQPSFFPGEICLVSKIGETNHLEILTPRELLLDYLVATGVILSALQSEARMRSIPIPIDQ